MIIRVLSNVYYLSSIKIIIKKIYLFPFIIITWFLGNIIPKKKNLILFCGSDADNYNESTRYLYEYLSNKDELDAVWISNRKETVNFKWVI